MTPLSADALDRLWSRIDHTAGLNSCWPWLGAKNKNGEYGQIFINGRNMQPHRVVCYLMHGELGPLNALHHCDNTVCCNPFHVYPGTQKRNVRDAIERGRYRTGGIGKFGSENSNSHYSDEQIAEIHRLLKTSLTQRQIAAQVGCSQRLVSQLYRGHAHANLESIPERSNRFGRLSDDAKTAILKLAAEGKGPYQIAAVLGCQPQTARRVIKSASQEPAF